jgi:hypothetical protein
VYFFLKKKKIKQKGLTLSYESLIFISKMYDFAIIHLEIHIGKEKCEKGKENITREISNDKKKTFEIEDCDNSIHSRHSSMF